MVFCVFCDIIKGKSPSTKIEAETDEYVIFKDIKPASKYHYLCVTKRHIECLTEMTKDDIYLVNQMEEGLQGFFKSLNIDLNGALLGFHMPPIISVYHLHMHGIAPGTDMSQHDRYLFKTPSYWFKTVEEANQYLASK